MAHIENSQEKTGQGVIAIFVGLLLAVGTMFLMLPVQDGLAAFARANFSVPKSNTLGPIQNTSPGPMENPTEAPGH